MTYEESLKADRKLAADIIWLFLRAPGGKVALDVLHGHFMDVDECRIDAILEDLADVIEDDDERDGWLLLTAEAKAAFGKAERGVCHALAEQAVT